MKTIFCILTSLLLLTSARATVSIEFQLGGINAPAGSLGVLVADTGSDGFEAIQASVDAPLSPQQSLGTNDVIVALFTASDLTEWEGSTGFAELFPTLDYGALGVSAGQDLILYVFPERAAGETIRTGEPFLAYRTEDLGQRTSNSNMEFSLPADGGAYLLACLASDVGGNADLAKLDIGAFPGTGASGLADRTLDATASHTYYFDFSSAAPFSLLGSVDPGVIAELLDPDGNQIAISDGLGDFLFNEEIGAGIHTLVMSRDPGAVGTLTYSLDYASGALRSVQPDVSVGRSLTSLQGTGIFDSADGQTVSLTSKRVKPVSAFATVANAGALPDELSINATRGNSLFGASYTGPAGNITASLIAGTFTTSSLASGDPALAIKTSITPNKRKLVKITKKGGKKQTRYLKKSFSTTIRAAAVSDPLKRDAGKISVRTR